MSQVETGTREDEGWEGEKEGFKYDPGLWQSFFFFFFLSLSRFPVFSPEKVILDRSDNRISAEVRRRR